MSDEAKRDGLLLTVVPGETCDSESCRRDLASRLGIDPERIKSVEVDAEDATMVNVTLRAAWEYPASTRSAD